MPGSVVAAGLAPPSTYMRSVSEIDIIPFNPPNKITLASYSHLELAALLSSRPRHPSVSLLPLLAALQQLDSLTAMTLTATTVRHERQYTLKVSMDSAADKEERKREYNRLAQREFRRRRKEHLKSLEQAQKEQSSERAEEIQRLRFQNEELKRENDALRAQIYSTSSTGHLMSNATMDNRQYSLSPSVSGTSLSGTGSPPNLVGPDMLPMGNLSMSASMMTPSLQAYTEHDLSTQSYSLDIEVLGLHWGPLFSP